MLIIMDVSAALPHHMSRIIEVLAKLATLSPFRVSNIVYSFDNTFEISTPIIPTLL